MHIKEMNTGAVYQLTFNKTEGHERRACPACNPEKTKNLPFGFNHDQGIGYCHKCESRFKLITHSDRRNQEGNNLVNQANTLRYDPKPPSAISLDNVRETLQVDKPFEHRLQTNAFLRFLNGKLGKDVTKRLADFYLIGTAHKFGGSPVFWQIDHNHKVRSGKIIGYNSKTGKRLDCMNWVHAAYKGIDQKAFNLCQCLFGAHLIPDSSGPFAIVESEKTAIIASYYLPGFTWLATGGKSNLKADKLSPLKNHPVILFPDLNAADEWEKQIEPLKGQFRIAVSRLLEEIATEDEKQQGLDLADYLLSTQPLESEDSSSKIFEESTTLQRPKSSEVSSNKDPVEASGNSRNEPALPDTSHFRKTANGYLEPVTEADQQATYDFFLAKNPKLQKLVAEPSKEVD